MKARALRNKAAIVGIGCTDFSRDSGRSEYQLALEAAVAACRDAGISPHEIDCITLSSYQSETVDEAELINGLGMKNLSYLGLVGHGGGAGCAVVGHAALAIATGMAETALSLRALNPRASDANRLALRLGCSNGLVERDCAKLLRLRRRRNLRSGGHGGDQDRDGEE